MTATTEPHACAYPEVLIEDTDADSNLQAGMRVLLPLPCRRHGIAYHRPTSSSSSSFIRACCASPR